MVFAGECFAGRRTLCYRRVSADDGEAVGLVSEKNVRDFFHQSGTVSLPTVRRIQDD